jgi:tRNA(fMet)-specific endonuclease VapC
VTIRFLLDTNILSEALKPEPNPYVISKLDNLWQACAMASITRHELFFGVLRLPQSQRRTRLEAYLASLRMPILAYEQKSAELHAKLRVNLVAAGLTPSFGDGQIASIAMASSLTVVTRNVVDFRNYPGLTLENWFEPG